MSPSTALHSPADAVPPLAAAPRPRRHAAEEVRRRQLIEATVEAIAELGFHASTLIEIAGRAGVSPGLVAFYFRDKDGLLEATLRHLAATLSQTLIALLRDARGSRARLQAVIDAALGPSQFERRTACVWLAFWAQVAVTPRFARIQRIYEARMLSNLRAGYRAHPSLAGVDRAHVERLAEATAAMIDGLWLRATLSAGPSDGAAARALAADFVDARLALLDLALLQKGRTR